jgi:hypothetical protein
MAGLAGWHVIVLLVFGIIPFVLWLLALVQVAQSKATGSAIALWIVIITVSPVLGAILWFTIGRRTATQGLQPR